MRHACHVERSRDISHSKSFSQTARDSSTSERFAEMLTNEFNDVGLASLQGARLGFPAENARAAGKRRHILRSDAFADT